MATRLVHALSDTPVGRALLACFFDLPRWALMNLLFIAALTGALLAWIGGRMEWAGLLTLPAALVVAAMVNMAARQATGDAPRWRDVMAWPATWLVAFGVWAVGLLGLAMLLADPPPIVFFTVAAVLLGLLMIGVFALCLPALLNVSGLLVWRNALVLAVANPITALGLLALLAVAGWAAWVTRGGLLLVTPALWTLIAVFTVHDRIVAMQAATAASKRHAE